MKKKSYKIIGRTNGWIAQRDYLFNGRTEIVIESGMTLKEAQDKLLQMFNEEVAEEYKQAANWGVAVNMKAKAEAYRTRPDGTRGYEYDSRSYNIEEE